MPAEFVRSKIVCTIGPASSSRETMEAMKKEGMDVARLNLSHGSLDEHRRFVEALRGIGELAILMDLPGPRIRLGALRRPVELESGARIKLSAKEVVGDSNLLPVGYENLIGEVSPGDRILINDGLVEVRITDIDEDDASITGVVVSGGEVDSHKGVNIPDADLTLRPPTRKDLEGIRFGVEMDTDWFAASFIRDARDVEKIRDAIREAGGEQPIVSKVEHGDAVENIEEIVEASDAIMVARGDLGIEVDPWEVPLIQKRIISSCNDSGKPVIVATQMLESMATSPRPTRAEASDVANAILDGADAVMLSGETATGLFPVEAVRTMNRITLAVERGDMPRGRRGISKGLPLPDVIGDLASRAVDAVGPAAIIVVTRSGFSALMVSKHRPATRILAVCRDERVRRRTHLYWGVEPMKVSWIEDRDSLITGAIERGVEEGFFSRGDAVMVVSGSTLIAPGRTSTLDILEVEDVLSYSSRRD